MSTQACNLMSLYVVNYLTASRIVTVGRDGFWGALGIPNQLKLSPRLSYGGNNSVSFVFLSGL